MVRLTRAQQQARTRASVLVAARTEFTEHGYTDAKIDRIAERADLTRGAVYSNFPSKRALYLAVLVDSLDDDATEPTENGTAAWTAGTTEAETAEAGTGGAGATRNAEAGTGTAGAIRGETTAAGPGGKTGTVGSGPVGGGTAGRAGARTVGGGTAGGVGAVGGRASEGLGGALGAFARVWLERLPLSGDTPAGGELRLRSTAGLFDDERGRAALAQVTWLEALLLGLALESHAPHVRRVRLAELVLTLLNGSGHLAGAAPGFGDPFDVARACRHLAVLDLADSFDPPHLPFAVPATSVREAWDPPAALPDEVTGRPAAFDGDGVIAVLGTGRLRAAEEAVRAARPGDRVTVAVVTADPAEVGRLVRLRIGDLARCLRRAFAPDAWPDLRLVLDERAAVAAAAGVAEPGDDTEVAVRVRAGEIVARADGRGAAHSVAADETGV